MNDLLPDILPAWQRVERLVSGVLAQYGYREIRFPVVEKTELYARSIGAVTDIVEKEMYSFEDRNGEHLTLRPEGTAGCVRAGIENGLFYNQVQRLWYAGPMFRHERPQKGRYRQFHQIGVESYGMAGPDIDAEIVLLTARLWRVLGVQGARLEVNSLGTPESRSRYRSALVAYFEGRRQELDDDSQRRLSGNPLRILDSKNPEMRPVIAGAPDLLAYLDGESRAHFETFQAYLRDAGVPFVVNPRLVRGLDYYTRTVFEWVADGLGAQATICAGGRYDGLVEQLGGGPVPAIGFALGLERLIALLSAQPEWSGAPEGPDAYVVVCDPTAERPAMRLAEELRNDGFSVALQCGGGSVKSQMRRADRVHARCALLAGTEGPVTVKVLATGAQADVERPAVTEYLRALGLGGNNR